MNYLPEISLIVGSLLSVYFWHVTARIVKNYDEYGKTVQRRDVSKISALFKKGRS